MGDEPAARIEMNLGLVESRWIGQFDVEAFGVTGYPVEVSIIGRDVKLHFAGPNADFEGTLTRDGERLSGRLRSERFDESIQFHRMGDAHFSGDFLLFEAAADDSTRVHELSGDAAELRAQFNADRDRVRLLMLLSPTCPGCQRGARVVQDEILEVIPSDRFAIYVVWEGILRTDDERGARKASSLFSDPRVRNYWSADAALGRAFQPVLGLTAEPAWDVYLLYLPGARWDGDPPPMPSLLHHQLGERLPAGAPLDGVEIARTIRHILYR